MPTYQSYGSLPAGTAVAGAAQLAVVPSGTTAPTLPPVAGGKFVGVSSAAPRTDNWLDELIGPSYIDYPLWVPDQYMAQPQQPQQPTTPPSTTPPATTPPAMTPVGVQQQPVAMLQMPGMAAPVPVMLMATMATIPQQPSTTPPTGNGGTTSTTPPVDTMPVSSSPVRTFSQNPAFAPATSAPVATTTKGKAKVRRVKHPPKGGGTTVEAVEIDATPIKLKVPQGCNAIEVILGEIEPMPGGTAADIADLLDAGKQRITDTAGGELDETQLNPGDVVNLVIPWRALATATIAEGSARRSVRVEFYNGIQNFQQS
jgi:hypothetical protein